MNKGIWLTSLSATLYGSIGYFGSSLIDSGFSVPDMLLWRFLLSTLILLPFLPVFLKDRQGDARTFLTILFLGGVFYAGGTVAYFESAKLIGTGLAMVIFFAYPIFVVGMSLAVDKSRLSILTVISVALIIIGCALIAFGQEIHLDLKGIGLALLSGLGYGSYLFWSKRTTRSVAAIPATFAVCLGNTIAMVLYLLLAKKGLMVPAGTVDWMHAGLFGLIGTVLPVLLLLAGMKTISANKASIISVLEPVTTLAVGALILGEAVTTLQFVGALVILSSAILIQLDKERVVA